MSTSDDAKVRTHAAIKDGITRAKIEEMAREQGLSFNKAMKKYFESEDTKTAA